MVNVSVIIPNYNYASYIKECITSIYQSNFDKSKLEVIIVDDGSNDNSIDIIKEAIKDAPVKTVLIENVNNIGHIKSRNLAINCSTGKYFFLLDSDNYILPDCLQKHYDYLSAHPDCTMAYAPIMRFDDITRKDLYIFSNEAFDMEKLKQYNFIDNMAMIKKSDFVEIGMLDENMDGWHDYELWLRMGFNNKEMHFLDTEVLSYYRVHNNSLTNTRSISNQVSLKAHIDNKYGLNINKGVNNINVIDDFKLSAIERLKVKISWCDSTKEFKPEDSQNKYCGLDKNKQELTFIINSRHTPIEQIQFNIGNKVGLVNIHLITITDNQGNRLWNWNERNIEEIRDLLFIQNAENSEEKIVQLSTSSTPGFTIKTDTNGRPIKEIIIKLTLSSTSPEDIEPVNEQLNRPLTYIAYRDINALKNSINALHAEQANLLQQLEAGKAEHNNYTLRTEEEKKQLATQVSNINSALNQTQERNNALEQYLQELRQANELLNNSVILKDVIIDELRNKSSSLISVLDEKSTLINSFQVERHNFQNNLKGLTKELEIVAQHNAKLIETLTERQLHIASLDNELKGINMQNINLSDKFLTYVKENNTKLEHLQLNIADLTDQVFFLEENYKKKSLFRIILNRLLKKDQRYFNYTPPDKSN